MDDETLTAMNEVFKFLIKRFVDIHSTNWCEHFEEETDGECTACLAYDTCKAKGHIHSANWCEHFEEETDGECTACLAYDTCKAKGHNHDNS